MPNIHHSKNIVLGSITAGGDVIVGDTTYINNYFAGQEVKIPHRLTNYIPTNAEYILGRDTELETITKYLEAKKPTVLVNGIGGIGKTSVAIKYMAIHGEEYKHLAWVTVQSSILETFISNSALLESLQITEKVQDLIKAKQLDNAFELVFHQLNILEKTLVVLDNANDFEDLEKYEHLFDTASCHFLITSRTYPSGWTTIAIDSLPEEEALRLFKKLHPSVQASDEAIKSLLSKLFYHTLLIELVAKSIESSAYVFEELQEIIETQFIHHATINEKEVSTGKHGSVVKDNLKRSKIEDYIWLIFSKVKGLDEKSRNILMSMALLPLAFMIERNDLKEHLSVFDLKEPMPALVVLVERGWVDRIKSLEQKTFFKMHPLVADVIIKHLEVNVLFSEKYIETVAKLIDYNVIDPNHSILTKNKKKPFAERLSYLFRNENTESISELLDRLAYLEENYGYYDKALFYNERALEIAKMIYDDNHSTLAVRQNNLAWVYQLTGKNEEAIELLNIALENNSRNYGAEDPCIAVRKSNIAIVYQNLNKNELAAELLESALAINIKNYGEDASMVAITRSNLAAIYTKLERYDEAINLLEKAMLTDLRNLTGNHPNVAIRFNNLAHVYKKVGRDSEAKTLWHQAYQNYLINLGAEHPHTIILKQRAEI